MKYLTLAKIITTAAFILPMTASAEHMDVIENEFVDGCTPAKYQVIVNDFNEWAKDYGYNAKIAYPTISENLTRFFWLGTSKDGATFSAASDAWSKGLSDPKSAPAKINARLENCAKLLSRSSYSVG